MYIYINIYDVLRCQDELSRLLREGGKEFEATRQFNQFNLIPTVDGCAILHQLVDTYFPIVTSFLMRFLSQSVICAMLTTFIIFRSNGGCRNWGYPQESLILIGWSTKKKHPFP